ncbi:MAG: anaerobic sulfatase maturase [Betaproteobacteria bacterium]|nr:MAG: anaerobic sulfatase maturase [Betaproteobacteria bacterium]
MNSAEQKMVPASREFQVMVKPIGAVCNLDCQYCYYLEKKDLYPKRELFRLADDLLERYIVQHIGASPTQAILFSWHGGEPTLLGLDYFRRIVELQRKHRPPAREILNGIQTNGALLDEEWCRFLAAEGFFVGLSMDGPRELHDCYRIDKHEKATHKSVQQAFRLLQRHRVHCDVLCVVHNQNVRQPTAVYRFFKDIGVRFLQFLPLVVRRGNGAVGAQTVPAEAYGAFLCTIFDEWVRHDLGRVNIHNFDEATRPFLGMEHAVCVSRQICGNIVVLEHNGDVYSCDHFVDQEHRLGNICETPLAELLESPALLEFGRNKRARLPGYCRQCDVLVLCNGGCPKDRLARTPTGEEGLNHLCSGLKRFYTHSRPYLQKLAWHRRSGEPMESYMRMLKSEDAAAAPQANRNDPCPCGSGRKYKKCCRLNPAS